MCIDESARELLKSVEPFSYGDSGPGTQPFRYMGIDLEMRRIRGIIREGKRRTAFLRNPRFRIPPVSRGEESLWAWM